jgi:regulator of protease activity HflC (stomatin/prohibitin superfamily)
MTWIAQIFAFFREFQVWIVVAPWEQALRIRGGKVAHPLGPGLHFKIPFVDKIYVMSVRARTVMDNGQTLTTKDGKSVTLSLAVTYSIIDLHKLFMSVSNPESTLLNQAQILMANIFAETDSSELRMTILIDKLNEVATKIDWGLGDIKIGLTNFAMIRAYKLINQQTYSSAYHSELPGSAAQ